MRKIARALGVEPQEFFREPALSGKVEAPREAGPTLLEKALDAVLQDEERTRKTINREKASEGVGQNIMSAYAEEKFRAELREHGFPDKHFDSFTWPVVVELSQAKQENARLEQENARLEQENAMRQELEISPE